MAQPRWQDSFYSTQPEQPQIALADPLGDVIDGARSALLSLQNADGSWCGELEGDSILESETLLLLAFLGEESSPLATRIAESLAAQQMSDGHWGQYPGAPIDVSASVKAYFALKLVGVDPNEPHMQKAVEAIHAAGGAEQVNSFTRFYLALLGVIAYSQCPAVPPELMLLPKWCPFNILEMSAWSRTIVVPLSIIWATQPVRHLQNELGERGSIDELFLTSPRQLPVTMPTRSENATERRWQKAFLALDRTWKIIERVRLLPLRWLAVRKADRWMRDRFEYSDGVGAIFPPIVWSLVALRGLGESDAHPDVLRARLELEKLLVTRSKTTNSNEYDATSQQSIKEKIQPCMSPVWDTAIATIALAESGLTGDDEPLLNARKYLLSKQTTRPGDWSQRMPDVEPGGWYFEHANEYYPDIDDTAMVLMALSRTLPVGSGMTATLSPTPGPNATYSAVVSGRAKSSQRGLADVMESASLLEAMSRGLRWLIAMRSSDGGWAAFDRDNTREVFCHVPFADHNAMIDPPTADITARVLETFGRLGIDPGHDLVRDGARQVWRAQEYDGAWEGRWGINYLYGTWQVIEGLVASGTDPDDPGIQHAVRWLNQTQQEDGGWGETPATYDDPSLRGTGTPTASQTAWAILGLVAAGQADTEACHRGVDWLMSRQRSDGTWDEPEFTGTGFPKVFYLRYHLYPLYFPLMALARYRRATTA